MWTVRSSQLSYLSARLVLLVLKRWTLTVLSRRVTINDNDPIGLWEQQRDIADVYTLKGLQVAFHPCCYLTDIDSKLQLLRHQSLITPVLANG